MVRRLTAVTAFMLVVAVAGCKGAFSGHQDIVATAAGQELTVERVASMIAPAKSVPLRREIIDRIADMWVDYQLLAQAMARGDSLMDSATVETASFPIVVQALVSAYHDSVVGKSIPTTAQIDSAYSGNDHRYIFHILVAARGDTTEAVKAVKRRTAQGYLDQLRRGVEFQQLAGRVSEDPSSKVVGGSLGLIPRGIMVKPFEDAAFSLTPGQMSPQLVETAFGYHILWRPDLTVVRDSFVTHLQTILAERADSVFLDSLTTKTGISVSARAPAIVKSAAQNIRVAKTRSRTLASWRGGELTEREFANWLQAFGPQTLGQIVAAPDSTLTEFVKSIARNEMLVAAARLRRIGLTAGQRDTLRMRFRDELVQMTNGMGVSPESLAADTAAGTDRAAVAARHVDTYFTAITNNPGSRQYYQVPPYLGDVLRARASWKVYSAGVDRALERAVVLRGPETPTAPGGMPSMGPAPIQRAPGGPPVGGGPQPQQPRP